jgi:rhodanese-related sulfurtransferase
MSGNAVKIGLALILVGGSVGVLLVSEKNAPQAAPAVNPVELVKNGALLLDVRSPGEFNSGHLDGAVNIPIDQLGRRMAELGPKTRAVVVYCQSGGRSRAAAQMLSGAGYQVHDVGPMSAWPGR